MQLYLFKIAFYSCLELERGDFSSKYSLEPLDADKSRILCLGSSLGENFIFRLIEKKQWTSANRGNLCKFEEKSAVHVLNCAKIRIW